MPTTLSSTHTAHHRRVDLLKINVERAELDVLKSLDFLHWRYVRQVMPWT
jgi:FkbM family methyltransferase